MLPRNVSGTLEPSHEEPSPEYRTTHLPPPQLSSKTHSTGGLSNYMVARLWGCTTIVANSRRSVHPGIEPRHVPWQAHAHPVGQKVVVDSSRNFSRKESCVAHTLPSLRVPLRQATRITDDLSSLAPATTSYATPPHPRARFTTRARGFSVHVLHWWWASNQAPSARLCYHVT